jgi:hypothetical protein
MAIKGRPYGSEPTTPEEHEELYQYVGPVNSDDDVDEDAESSS